MRAAMDDAWDSTSGGDVVIVSHQAPIWIAHLSVAGEKLAHDPRSRRCALSSVTSFERRGTTWREVAYAEPAARAVQASMAVKIFIFSWFYVFEKQGFYELWACRDIW